MEKEIVITGVAGFIGYAVAKRLLDLGYTVVGIDNLNDYYDVSLKEYRLKILRYYADKFIFYKKDIADKKALDTIFNSHKPQKILHLAAQAGVRYSIENPDVYITTNLNGFANILEIARQYNLPMVFASSSSVYGNNSANDFKEEDDTSKAISLYAATKKANEVMAHSYAHLFKIPLIGLRFFTVYGPWGRPDMALFKFTKNILEGKKIDVYNNGEMFRDFTYIDDIVDGILQALNYDMSSYDKPFELFNLGCGNPRKLIDFIKFIELYCDKEANMNLMPIQPGDVLKTSANIDKARSILKFNPKIKIEDGLHHFVEWYKQFYKQKI